MPKYSDKKRHDKNGYVIVEDGVHPKAFKFTGNHNEQTGVYEHVLVAEELIDRPLKTGEVVHHLDLNRANNSPDNLLVISGPMHAKLHGWLSKHVIIPKAGQAERIQMGCIRCKACEKPISAGFVYCSQECGASDSRKVERPTGEQLRKLVWSKPTSQLAKDYNVSDKAIEKWCKLENIEKPPRGYWTKVKQ